MERLHALRGRELARERARECSENSASDQSPSRASSLPQGAYCMQSAERLPHALPMGASLLTKGPVQGSENSAPDQSPSRASSLPQGAYCMQSAERLPHALPVGASLLAKGPVNVPKTVRLINRLREQARSHKGLTACNRRSACHTHSLWERACSRKGPYRLRKQRA